MSRINAKYKTANNIEYDINIDPYDTYSNGKIYIGTDLIKISHDSKDIFILDERNKKNPNMKICNSYKITDYKERQEILESILKYEKEFPSDWDRTIDSMTYEWFIHNLFSNIGILRYRTNDVDLDNNDEEFYTKLLKYH